MFDGVCAMASARWRGGEVLAEKGVREDLMGAPDAPVDLRPGNVALASYRATSARAANAGFESLEDMHCAIIATKDIPKSAEVFVSYGETYWLSRLADS